MVSLRAWTVCLLIGMPLQVRADVAPPYLGSRNASQAQTDTAARKIATCSPSYEEEPGPFGTLITHRAVQYDVMAGAITVTPAEARPPLRSWIDRVYKALRPCLPQAPELHAPERLLINLHVFLSSARVNSAVALATDKRVDTKCVEAVLTKQEAPALPVPLARLDVEITLAPFCVISHETQRGNELPSPRSSGFGSAKRGHLMPLVPRSGGG